MGMPTITLEPISRDDAINNLIASIALQEAALSHILNANGEKLQVAIKLVTESDTLSLPDLIAANQSVKELVRTVAEIENILREKLRTVLEFLREDNPDGACCDCCNCDDCCDDCDDNPDDSN